MIPESIEIDENGDFEVRSNGTLFYKWSFEQIEEAYLLAKNKRPPIIYGCHIDEDQGEIYNDCELDEFENRFDCKYAKRLKGLNKCKTDCQYWRPVEVKK